jgi:hypothetical protein
MVPIEAGSNFNPNSNEFANLDDICHLHSASILNDAAIMPAVTNTTACKDGFFAGYKDWCIHHALDCVENITMGDFPDMILKAHDQILAGENAANGSGNSMCPIGENAAFCRGWDNNNDDYGNQDCSDDYPANAPDLVGCPFDNWPFTVMHHAAGLSMLAGTWNYLNESKSTGLGISGKIVYGKNGDFNLTIPSSPFGNYRLERSWAVDGHVLTECYAGGCENNTLTTVTPNHIDFKDNNNNNTIHLKKASNNHLELQPSVELGATAKSLNFNYILNLTGTWAIINPNFMLMNSENLNGTSTITFNNYIKHAHWKYTQYCCGVNIREFTANVGHTTFEGYWEADLSPSPLPSTLELCEYNIQDHGEYHDDTTTIKGILSGCTKMTLDIIDSNHLNLYNPAKDTVYLVRLVEVRDYEPVN